MEYNFDEIRSYSTEEIPAAMQRLTGEKAFMKIVSTLFPLMPKEQLRQTLLSFTKTDDLQRKMIYPFLQHLEANKTSGVSMSGLENIDPEKNYLFISNHRDIILDSALFCYKLIDEGLDTVEIAIGDNLLVMPWIEDLVRVNKSFIVQRGLSARKIFESSQRLSAYLRHVIHEKKSSIWLAQREGRAKDADDRTQESLLKMLNMGGSSGNFTENLKELNIVPLSITYEYDPCDYLKAQEFQQKRDNPEHKKTQQDDLINMQTGVMGYKGRVHYHIAPPINPELDKIASETTNRNKQVAAVARLLDHHIHSNYAINPNNYVALDLLNNNAEQSKNYSTEDLDSFNDYLDKQIRKVNLPEKDREFLLQRMLEMYANPLINYQTATKQNI